MKTNIFKLKTKFDRITYVIVSVFLFGLIAHGQALFGKFSFHDDISLMTSYGASVSSGRFMLLVFEKLHKLMFGLPPFSLNLYNGIICFIFIIISVVLIIDLFDIQSRIQIIVISALMVTFPVITGQFGYAYEIHVKTFSLLLSILSIYILCKSNKVIHFLFSILIFVFSIGIYQAYIPFSIALINLHLIYTCIDDDYDDLKRILFSIIKSIGFIILGILIYYIILKVFLFFMPDIHLADYKGINNVFNIDILTYLKRIMYCIRNFIFPYSGLGKIYFGNHRVFYFMLVIVIGYCAILFFINIMIKNRIKAIIYMICILVFPITTNFIFVMCAKEEIHVLMKYGEIMPYFLFIIYINEINKNKLNWTSLISIKKLCKENGDNIYVKHFYNKLNINNVILPIGKIVLIYTIIFFIFIANVAYLKANFVQKRMENQLNIMVERIQSMPGYDTKFPVCFVADNFVYSNDTYKDIKEFNFLDMYPYVFDMRYYIARGAQQIDFLNKTIGFYPKIISVEKYKDIDEIKNMKVYPNDGSIIIYDNVVFIKLNE